MSCQFEPDLTAFLDRELAPLRKKQLEAHLLSCGGCSATLSLLRRAVAQLSGLPELSPSFGLRRRVMARLEEPATLGEKLWALFRPSVLMPALGMAAALATVAGLFATRPALKLDPEAVYLARNMEMIEDYEVLGLEPEDLELVENLHELEALP